MSNPEDRRSSARYAVSLSADVHVAGRNFTTRTRDLSAGGVCLDLEESIASGTPLTVSLFLVVEEIEDPNVPSLSFKGTIAWSKPAADGVPSTVGVKFDRISPGQLAGLTRFLKAVNTR